ncbi:phage head closure protein [Bosea vaviloviae]|uniref:Phage head-tail adapter protein n=1 Tax=Bosea vaviloviae TaxID=1526658 RepID=A0A0N0MC20_9HYPH|nr:phage head closure protein [Bosea vaviloviae]KPH80567.1 hypothetical protein AE618_12425 [Bosea vaviloviae]
MTTAGDLDRRIVIERFVVVGDDGYGNEITEWRELASIAASRLDVSDTERVAFGRLVSTRVSRFVIRAAGPQASVNAVDRLAHDGLTWEIIGVKEAKDGRNRFLEITAAAGG